MARLFRNVRSDPPQVADFRSQWDKGWRPKSRSPSEVLSFKAISVWERLDLARQRGVELNLGDFVAELEVPDSIKRRHDTTGHVDLYGTIPQQVRGWVKRVHSRAAKVRS